VVQLDELENLLGLFVRTHYCGLDPEAAEEHLENRVRHGTGCFGAGAVVPQGRGRVQPQLGRQPTRTLFVLHRVHVVSATESTNNQYFTSNKQSRWVC